MKKIIIAIATFAIVLATGVNSSFADQQLQDNLNTGLGILNLLGNARQGEDIEKQQEQVKKNQLRDAKQSKQIAALYDDVDALFKNDDIFDNDVEKLREAMIALTQKLEADNQKLTEQITALTQKIDALQAEISKSANAEISLWESIKARF